MADNRRFGKYPFNSIFIDANSNDIDEISFHELVHFSLTQSTSLGALMFVMHESDRYSVDFGDVPRVLMNSCILCHETSALASGFRLRRHYQNGGGFESYLSKVRETDNYRRYAIDGFDDYVRNDETADIDRWDIFQIARIAMMVDISSADGINYFDSDSITSLLMQNPTKYWADFRFKLLFREYMLSINQGYNCEVKEIADKLGLELRNYTANDMKSMIDRLCESIMANDTKYSNLCSRIRDIKIYELEDSELIYKAKQLIVPQNLNLKLTDREVRIGISKSDMSNSVATVIFVNDENGLLPVMNDLIYFYDKKLKKHYARCVQRNDTIRFIDQFDYVIIVYYEDYEYAHGVISKSKRIFYRYDGPISDLIEFIKSMEGVGNPSVHYRIYDNNVCLILFRKGGVYFFTLQYKDRLIQIVDMIKAKDLHYQNVDGSTSSFSDCLYFYDINVRVLDGIYDAWRGEI